MTTATVQSVYDRLDPKNQKPMMTPLELVKAGYQCFATGDIDGLLALCAEDIEWIANGPASLEKCKAYNGHDGVRQFQATLGETWELSSFAPHEFIVQGDTVVVLGEEAGCIRASGEPFENRWVHVFDVRDGKCVRFRDFLCHWVGDQKPPVMS